MTSQSHSSFPTLRTERLTLRQLLIDDRHEVFALRTDPEINKYLNREPCKTMEDAEMFINRVADNITNNKALYWAITLSNTNTFAGTVCVFGFSDDNNSCEIGYELLTRFQGQGMMKEAMESVLAYVFKTIPVQKIEAVCHRNNLRSIRLLENLRFIPAEEQDKTENDLKTYRLIC